MSTVEVSAPEAAPPSPGRWRALLLAAVAACASSGLASSAPTPSAAM
ncbi:hypothetical protein [Mycobacterium avium]|nr:hypothetical protein [Mycobacterium avium]